MIAHGPDVSVLIHWHRAAVRPIVLHPKAREAIRRFPKEARIRLGRGLFRLQMGEQVGMPHSRPMPGVGAGVSELRVKGADSYRTFYYTNVVAGGSGLSRLCQEDPANASA
jgi:phage-related protein